MVEGLAKKGHEAKLRDAVTILSAPDKNVDPRLRERLHDHFGSLTRAVVEVPYDASLVSGSGIDLARLAPATRDAWLDATAVIARGRMDGAERAYARRDGGACAVDAAADAMRRDIRHIRLLLPCIRATVSP